MTLDEHTKELVNMVSGEYVLARETLLNLLPELENREIELMESAKMVVVEVNDFLATKYITDSRKGLYKGGEFRKSEPKKSVACSPKQLLFLVKRGEKIPMADTAIQEVMKIMDGKLANREIESQKIIDEHMDKSEDGEYVLSKEKATSKIGSMYKKDKEKNDGKGGFF